MDKNKTTMKEKDWVFDLAWNRCLKEVRAIIQTYRFDLTTEDTKTYCDEGLYLEVENLLSKMKEMEK